MARIPDAELDQQKQGSEYTFPQIASAFSYSTAHALQCMQTDGTSDPSSSRMPRRPRLDLPHVPQHVVQQGEKGQV